MSRVTKFTIGADPEFFLWDNTTNMYVSAHDKVPGDKANPVKLPDGSAVQADGTAVEFNIEPATTPKEFSDKIKSALNELRKIIPNRYLFQYKGAIQYSAIVWQDIPAKAKELGCDPDWKGNIGSSIKAELNQVRDPGSYRTGSGHIHLGWTEKEDTSPDGAHFLDCVTMIQNLDFIYQSKKHAWDTSYAIREQFYGAARAFRCKPYGVEYRSPSNEWLAHPVLYPYIAEMVLYAAKRTAEGHYTDNYIFNRVPNLNTSSRRRGRYDGF